MYRRILVPLDGSPLAEKSLEPAANLAQLTGAELILFRALALPGYAFLGPGAFPTNVPELADKERESAESYLRELSEPLLLAGLRVSTVCREGRPDRAILQAADELHVDLLVLSTHGQGGLGRWVYGNVAEKVLRRCHQQVLLVRTVEPARPRFRGFVRKA